MSALKISHVTDTAFWVCAARAIENERPDALIRDPYADRLAGSRGHEFQTKMKYGKYVLFTVVFRTLIIDRYIQEMVNAGVDTVLNLGAGLDARPYRMNLPASLNWIEVDFPAMIEHKEKILEADKPKVQLERVKLDLSNGEERRKLLARVNAQSKKFLVLTEGVIPYLSNEDVAILGKELRALSHCAGWIVEYFAPEATKRLRSGWRKSQMANAPFKFEVYEWEKFFKETGWRPKELQYLGEEGQKVGRKPPMPVWFPLIAWMFPMARKKQFLRMTGYSLLTPII